MHANTGHAAPRDMARTIRLAGGTDDAVELAKALKCGTCERMAQPSLPRPAHIRPEDLQFNDDVLGDPCQVFDASGQAYWMLANIDDATNYCTLELMESHESGSLWKSYREGWLRWAGPPRRYTCDNGRGLLLNENVEDITKAGSYIDPSAPFAPWPKGNVERLIQSVKTIVKIPSVIYRSLARRR